MKHKQHGFALLEVLLIVVVIAAVAATSVYVWRRHDHDAAKTNATIIKQPYQTQSGLIVYSSTHSSLHFSYPSSWQLTKNTIPASNAAWLLEDVTLKGPNNFVMSFELQKDHVNPGASCARETYGSTTTLGNDYVMASTLDAQNATNVTDVDLVASSSNIKSGDSGCGIGFYPNALSDNLEFTFSGSYTQNGDINLPVSKPASSYFDQGEVQTAKQIFTSVQS